MIRRSGSLALAATAIGFGLLLALIAIIGLLRFPFDFRHARTGMEDTLTLRRGVPVTGNGDLGSRLGGLAAAMQGLPPRRRTQSGCCGSMAPVLVGGT